MYAAPMALLLQLSAHMRTPSFESRTGTDCSRQSARGFLQNVTLCPTQPRSVFFSSFLTCERSWANDTGTKVRNA